jgi:predicted nucleotidyltransferase
MRQFLTSPQSELAARIERAFLEESRAGIVSVYLFGSHAEERSHRER